MPSSHLRTHTLAASLSLFAGCGGEPPVVDNATVIPAETAKPGPEAAKPAPETTPAKDAPKD
jgi:hypothetical protein